MAAGLWRTVLPESQRRRHPVRVRTPTRSVATDFPRPIYWILRPSRSSPRNWPTC